MKIAEVSKRYGIPQETLRYYERVNVIPKIARENGIRNFTEDDCIWVQFAKCLRAAGLSVEAIIEYRRLTLIGDSTIEARCELLKSEREKLIDQKRSIDEALELLNYKVSRYEEAVKTGVLSWDKK